MPPSAAPVLRPGAAQARPPQPAAAEAAARRELRRQIGDLERRLADAAVAAFPHGALATAPAGRRAAGGGPRVLALGDLEVVRDELAGRLEDAHAELSALGARQEAARERLERMLREPRRHKFARLANAELGEGGCGVWQVRPRLGLLGMLAGWWEVKLSSGCPLPGGLRDPR